MALLVMVARSGDGDPGSLLDIANRLARGSVAYRDYPLEYPPLGLVHIALPRLIGGSSPGMYQTLFSLLGVVLALGTGAAIYWLAKRRWSVDDPTDAVLMFTGLCLAGAPLVIWRFDILPAFLTAAALVAYAARLPGWSGLSLGLGVMAKLYPAFLLPVFGAAQLFERRFRDFAFLVVGAAAALVVMAEIWLVAGARALSFVTYQEHRGVEIESITGGIAMLAGALGGPPAKVSIGFGAYQVASPLLATLATPALVFEIVAIALVVVGAVVSFLRDIRERGSVAPVTLVEYSLATLLAAIVTDKVLSPQYVVWLLPFVPLVGARKSLLFLVIVVITTIGYPLIFPALVEQNPAAVALLNLRNALLVVLFLWVAWPHRAGGYAAGSERGYVRDPAY